MVGVGVGVGYNINILIYIHIYMNTNDDDEDNVVDDPVIVIPTTIIDIPLIIRTSIDH